QLEIPPVGANSSRSLDAAASASDGGSRPARRCVWSGPDGEEFAPDTSASARVRYRAELLTVTVSGTLRRNVLGAIALGKERSQLHVATTTETKPEKRQHQARHGPRPTNPKRT